MNQGTEVMAGDDLYLQDACLGGEKSLSGLAIPGREGASTLDSDGAMGAQSTFPEKKCLQTSTSVIS
jgi:hypothetical protein